MEGRERLARDLRKRPVAANVATVRELACWVWAMAQPVGRANRVMIRRTKSGRNSWLGPSLSLDNVLLILKADAFASAASLVEHRGIEPLASRLRTLRSPS